MFRNRLGFVVLWLVVLGIFLPLGGCISVEIESTRTNWDGGRSDWDGTRISDSDAYAQRGYGRYPYRAKAAFILREMDLREGDVVVDIGAGDGWWSARIARLVGERGVVYAAEVEEGLVAEMQERYADVGQIRPYLCATDGTGLEENMCDLAFFSQVYHHLDEDGKVAYLRHLHDVVKPTGRLMIVERYVEVVTKKEGHGTRLGELIAAAEEADWVLLRYELMPGTYFYLTVFAQAERFPPESDD